jgi:hypothetical protein
VIGAVVMENFGSPVGVVAGFDLQIECPAVEPRPATVVGGGNADVTTVDPAFPRDLCVSPSLSVEYPPHTVVRVPHDGRVGCAVEDRIAE